MLDSKLSKDKARQGERILHYCLHIKRRGERVFYYWQSDRDIAPGEQVLMLVDLREIFLPDREMDRMVAALGETRWHIRALAFSGCHARNRQELKRKLKALNIKLFSNSSFFSGRPEAEAWLLAQEAKQQPMQPLSK